MRGAGDLHGDNRQRARQRPREPDEALETFLRREKVEELGDAYANERPDEVSPHQHARLRERCVDGTIDQHSRGSLYT